jgi:hypothetical protein
MRKLKLTDVTWTLNAEPEDVSVQGNVLASGNDAEDKKCENEILRDLKLGNEWAWCRAIVTGHFKGLQASSSLGCCSYKNKNDFKRGRYFKNMQAEILQQLQKLATTLYKSLTE